jgi:dihydroorotate dehydrogenase
MLFISPPFGNYITFLPYTTPILGSYTVESRDGLLSQIIKTLHYSDIYGGWVNKIGLRNSGIDYGLKKYCVFPGSVLSLALLHGKDVEIMNDKIPADANIELNISCPNEQVQFPQNVKKFIGGERKWCIVKLSPLERDVTIDNLYEMGFRQFHCCNTYPTALGGLSGPVLIPFVSEKIKYIKKKYKDCEVIAGGGIDNIKILNYYKGLGADHFSVSSLCFNPFRFGWFYFNYLMGGGGAPHAP